MNIPDEMRNILYANYFGYVCTSDRFDQPHLTPVFFVYYENSQKIFFITNERSKKIKNLSENPNVSITIDIRDPVNPFNNEGVMAQGTANITDRAPIYFLSEDTQKKPESDAAGQICRSCKHIRNNSRIRYFSFHLEFAYSHRHTDLFCSSPVDDLDRFYFDQYPCYDRRQLPGFG